MSSKKWTPPNILHWQVQTCPVLNKINPAVAQKYLSHCCQISYNSIIPLNRFFNFYKLSQISVTDMTCLLCTMHIAYVRHDVISLINVPARVLHCFQLRQPTSSLHSTGHRTAQLQSGWLLGLGHFARASLPLPDPWRRPSEKTTDCRMALIWPEHHWQSCRPVAGATAWVCQREWRTLSAWTLNASQTISIDSSCVCLEFNFWPTLMCILQKRHTAVWNRCGYPYIKLYLIWWSFTHGIAKSLVGAHFFLDSVLHVP